MEDHICSEIVPLFNGLDHEDLVKISSITRHQSVNKNELLFSPDNADQLLILASGSIKIYQLNKNGKEQLLRIMQPGDFEGEKILYGLKNDNLYASTLDKANICLLRKNEFDDLLMKYPEISQHLLSNFAEKLFKMEKQVNLLNSDSVEMQIANYLLDLQIDQSNNQVKIPMKMKELATYLGTTPETISRKFKSLENQNLITKKGNLITILNQDELENIF